MFKAEDSVESEVNGKHYQGKVKHYCGSQTWLVQCGTDYLVFQEWQLRKIEEPKTWFVGRRSKKTSDLIDIVPMAPMTRERAQALANDWNTKPNRPDWDYAAFNWEDGLKG